MFQTNGILTYSLEESSISYNDVCDIYILGFNVSDDEEVYIETIISVSNRSDSRMMFTSTENANRAFIMAAEALEQVTSDSA